MRSIIHNDFITMLSRIIMGAIFIYASFYKILEPALFAKSIWYYHLIPGLLINILALVLPWLELVVGLALIGGVYYRGAVLWVNIMMVVFIIALSSTIIRGIDVDCGCFKAGGSATGSATESLLLDFGMFALTLQLLVSKSKRWMLQRIT